MGALIVLDCWQRFWLTQTEVGGASQLYGPPLCGGGPSLAASALSGGGGRQSGQTVILLWLEVFSGMQSCISRVPLWDLYRLLAVLREPPFNFFGNISSKFLLLKTVFLVVLEGQQDPCSQWQRVWCCIWARQFYLSAFSSRFLGKEPASRHPFTNHPHPSSLVSSVWMTRTDFFVQCVHCDAT